MPIYAYRCRQCGDKFEAFRAISSNDDEVACPKCGAKKPVRVLSPVYGKTSDVNLGNLRFPT